MHIKKTLQISIQHPCVATSGN